MIKLLVILIFLALFFYFFYFIWKKKFLYSIISVVVFIVLFLAGAYLSSFSKNTWCLNPHKVPYTSELPLKLETGQDYFIKGNFEYDQGKCNDAINSYTKAIELDPTISQFYNNRGYTYMTKEDYASALKDLNKAIEIRPDYVRALMNRGDIYNYYYSIDKQKAIADYNKIIAQGPYAIEDTAVCGHKMLAKNKLFTPGWFFGMINLMLTRGKNCQ